MTLKKGLSTVGKKQKQKKVIRLMKDKRIGKIITKFAATSNYYECYSYCVQNHDHEIENYEIIRGKGVKNN